MPPDPPSGSRLRRWKLASSCSEVWLRPCFPRRCYSSAIISFNGFPGHCIMFCRVCNTIACDVLLDTWVKKKGDYGINSKNLTMTKVKNTAPWAAPRQSQGFWIPRRGFGIPITGFHIFFSGTWIPDSYGYILGSKVQDSGFHKQKFPRFWNQEAKIFGFPKFRFPYLGRFLYT